MGQTAGLTTISDANVGKVIADPPLVWLVLAPDDPEAYAEARTEWNIEHGLPPPRLAAAGEDDADTAWSQETKKPGFFARLFGAAAPPRRPPSVRIVDAALEPETVKSSHCYLDKSWHGIHYLLTGTAWEGDEPLNFFFGGGSEIDLGDQVARVFTAAEVQAIAAALQPIDADVLCARFDPTEMVALDIYPPIWDRDPQEDDTLGYCLSYFDELKAFVAGAASRGQGLVISIG